MERIRRWKLIVLAAVVPTVIALQPIITFASDCTGSHCGG